MDPVIVTIPARSEFVRLLRSVVSSVAARLRFGYDDIDDLRLAVGEACAHLLAASPPPDELVLHIALQDDGIDVRVSRTSAPTSWPPSGAMRTLAWEVLNALTDEARFEQPDGGASIAFSKTISAASREAGPGGG